MIGQARFTYTDQDMVATQRAGWLWCMRWRNLSIAFVAIVAFTEAVLLGLNAAYGTRSAPADTLFVILASGAETVLLAGLLYVVARNHGRQVLHSNHALAWNGDALGGAHVWAWDATALHLQHEQNHTDLAWPSVGGWLETPEVLLLFPSGSRPFLGARAGAGGGVEARAKSVSLPVWRLRAHAAEAGTGGGRRRPPARRSARSRRPGARRYGCPGDARTCAAIRPIFLRECRKEAATTAPARRSPSP